VAASGASVTVKTASGTVVATATTNSSGDASVALTGYVGQTLYAFVSYSTTNYLTFTGVLMGNFCGRTYNYDLVPVSDTIGGTPCGSITITTVACDGTTILGSKAWTLQKASAGGYTTYATGTTDATTGKSTVTGATYGGAFDGYRFVVTDATGTIAGTAFVLTSTNCVASVVMKMSTASGSRCSTPNDTVTLSAGGSGLIYQRGCAPVCAPVTVPGSLTLYDPQGPYVSRRGQIGFSSNTTYYGGSGCSGFAYTFAPDSYGTGSGLEINTAKTTNGGCYPYWFLEVDGMPYTYDPSGTCYKIAYYRLTFDSSGPLLEVGRIHSGFTTVGSASYSCRGLAATTITYQDGFCAPSVGGLLGGQLGNITAVAATSYTCNPFSATFNISSYTIALYSFGYPPAYYGSYTFPARTITVHA
jgi:hypothetical protein